MQTVIYDNQERDYNNPQPTDLDSVLYSKGLISSPNCMLSKFIFESSAGYKVGNHNTIEGVIEEMCGKPFILISSVEYCQRHFETP